MADLLAEFKKRQGNLTVVELRAKNPRWRDIFDELDTDKDNMLLKAEIPLAFSRTLSASETEPYPKRQLEVIYAQTDADGVGKIDFKQFYNLTKETVEYMAKYRRWQEIEEEADDKEEKQRNKEERERKKAEMKTSGIDIYEIMGVKKKRHEVYQWQEEYA